MSKTPPFLDPYTGKRINFKGPSVATQFNAPSTLEDFLGNAGTPWAPSYQDRVNAAAAMGYDRVDNSGRAWAGSRYNIPLMSVPVNAPAGSDLPPFLSQALLRDTNAMQGAADRQYARNNEQIGGLQDYLSSLGGDFQASLDRMLGPLTQDKARMSGLIDAAGRDAEVGGEDALRLAAGATRGVTEGVDRTLRDRMPGYYAGLDRAERDIEAGYRLGDEAVSGYRKAIAEYEDTSAQEASTQAYAIRRSAQSAMKMAQAGVHADGTPMTAAEQNAAVFQIQNETNAQVQAATTPIFARFNETKAALEGSLAQLRMGNAGQRLQGASLRGGLADRRLAGVDTELKGEALKADARKTEAQTALAVADQRSRARYVQAQMAGLGVDISKAMADLIQSSTLNLVNLEMQGRLNLAQLVQANPESVVSWFQGMMAMYSARAASTGNTRLG